MAFDWVFAGVTMLFLIHRSYAFVVRSCCWGVPAEAVCDRRLRLYSYALHKDIVRLTRLCCAGLFAPTSVVCERLQQHS
jgi:hypothetical protein